MMSVNNNSKDMYEQICQKLGIRLTDQRRLIVQSLIEAQDHPNVDELYQKLIKIDSNISLSTVYRTVSLLESYGYIGKLDFQDGKFRYEWKSDSDDHHHHLIDLESGSIIEFQDRELEELKAKIAKRLGYKLVGHRLELYGIPIHKDKK